MNTRFVAALWMVAGLWSQTASAQPVQAQAPPPTYYAPTQPPPDYPAYGQRRPDDSTPSGFSGKLAFGAGIGSLLDRTMYGFAPQLSLGAQIKDIGAVHAMFSMLDGNIDALRMHDITAGAAWEFILWRFRLGLGLHYEHLWIDRATGGSDMTANGLAVTGFVDFDLVQSAHVNLFLNLQGSVGSVFDETISPVGALRLGTRFKAP